MCSETAVDSRLGRTNIVLTGYPKGIIFTFFVQTKHLKLSFILKVKEKFSLH